MFADMLDAKDFEVQIGSAVALVCFSTFDEANVKKTALLVSSNRKCFGIRSF